MKNKNYGNKKNLRRISIVVTAQTAWHLGQICAFNGWGNKDIGRAVDKLVRAYCADYSNIPKNEKDKQKWERQ